jgi:hypothetical protein
MEVRAGLKRPLFRYFNSELENHFVVVYWDQRGAKFSFDPKADPHPLTIAQHVADLDAVVDHLRQSFSQDKLMRSSTLTSSVRERPHLPQALAEMSALAFLVLLFVLLGKRSLVFCVTLLGTICVAAGMAVWFAGVSPANAQMAQWNSVRCRETLPMGTGSGNSSMQPLPFLI